MRAALHAAAFGLMAERRRAQARERDMLRGVGAALAGRLPIHEAVLLDAREDAANGAAVEAAAAVEIVAGAAGGGCCGGGGGAQLADSDSDDSLILGRACAEGEVEVVASMPMAAAAAALRPAAQPLRPDARRRRLGLASATDDDTEIAAAEQELRSELKRSTLRCTNLRSSLAVMRQLAVHAGVHLYAAGGSPSASRAGAAAGQSPLAQPRALDERPIKPSPTPHIFGEPPAVLVEAELVAELAPAAAAATPDAAGACADATTSYDEDEIGDDEGNEQGALLLPPPAAAPVPTPLPPPPSLVERLAPPVTIPEVDNEEEGEDAVTSGSGSASSRSLGGGGRDAWSPAAAALSPASEAVLQALYAGSLAARARATRARLDAALGTTVLARVEAAVAAAAAAGGDIDVSADKAAEDDSLGEAAAAEAAAALAAVVAGLAPAQRALVADVEALVSMEAALL